MPPYVARTHWEQKKDVNESCHISIILRTAWNVINTYIHSTCEGVRVEIFFNTSELELALTFCTSHGFNLKNKTKQSIDLGAVYRK